MPSRFEPMRIPGVILITPQIFRDERGGFAEIFKHSEFAAAGIDVVFTQLNFSESRQNVVRGMHYQLTPYAQGKLVSVQKGRIFDVVIDIRAGSATYGQWVSTELDSETKRMLWVPPGFAHGFCVLSDVAEVMYAVTAEYSRESERGIMWNDPALTITWPVREPILSEKDAHYPPLSEADGY